MNPRTLLFAGALSLACPAVHAEELQVTVTGVGLTDITQGDVPVRITFDVNTLSGQQTSEFGSFSGGPNVLQDFDANNLALTNYSATIGGQHVFFASSAAEFGFSADSTPAYYDFTGNAGTGPTAFTFEVPVAPELTEVQFMASQDPLALMLLTYAGPPLGSSLGTLAYLEEPDVPPGSLRGTITFKAVPTKAVPTPGPLSLFLAGAVGLAVSRWRTAQSLLSLILFGRATSQETP